MVKSKAKDVPMEGNNMSTYKASSKTTLLEALLLKSTIHSVDYWYEATVIIPRAFLQVDLNGEVISMIIFGEMPELAIYANPQRYVWRRYRTICGSSSTQSRDDSVAFLQHGKLFCTKLLSSYSKSYRYHLKSTRNANAI